MATNESGSQSNTLQGAMVTMMAVGLVVQLAILGLLVWLVAGNSSVQPSHRDLDGNEAVPSSKANEGTSEADSNPGSAGSPGASQNAITLLRTLPPMIPDSERDLTWYSAGDELFALEATVTANYGGIPGAAIFRVPGRGSVESEEGMSLYPGSRIRVLKVTPDMVVVSNGIAERDLFVPRRPTSVLRGGTARQPSGQPVVSNDNGGIPDAPDGASMIRPTDPRLDALLRAKGLAPNQATSDTAPAATTQPRVESSTIAGTRAIAESYPAADWEAFIKELRQSLLKTVLLLDTFDDRLRPSGVEVANIFESDDVLFQFLRLEAGDVIVGIGGKPVWSKKDMDTGLRDQAFESEIRIQVDRNGEILDLVVKKFPQ
jgi:hypothetical protein